LKCYVREEQVRGILCYWAGDQDEPIKHWREITPVDLVQDDFSFHEREIITIVPNARQRRWEFWK